MYKRKILFGQYRKLKKLGSGSYGDVWLCEDRNGLKRAVKIICFNDWKEEVFSTSPPRLPLHLERELEAFEMLPEHPNVIPLLSQHTIFEEQVLGLIFPYIEGPDLYYYLYSYRRNKKTLPISIIKSLSRQLLLALDHIHKHGLVHRDLKPSNIMIETNTGNLKIIDFGLCRSLSDRKNTLSMEVFTRMYKPPEVLMGMRDYLSPSVDIWSAGAIVAELFTLSPIFRSISPHLSSHNDNVTEDESDFGQLMRIFATFGTPSLRDCHFLARLPSYSPVLPQWDPPMPSSPHHLRRRLERFGPVPDEAYDFILRMLDLNPSRRPTAEELLGHPFIANAEIVPALPSQNITKTQECVSDRVVPATHDASLLKPTGPAILCA